MAFTYCFTAMLDMLAVSAISVVCMAPPRDFLPLAFALISLRFMQSLFHIIGAAEFNVILSHYRVSAFRHIIWNFSPFVSKEFREYFRALFL